MIFYNARAGNVYTISLFIINKTASIVHV